MKTLNLSEIGRILMLCVIICMGALTGCSEDEEFINPIFPELKEINCNANETGEISFEANLDWKISSYPGWCKFIDGELQSTTMSGKAGKQTIQIIVSADGQNYNEDAIAEITLTMGEISQVIYKVKRGKKEYENLVITDEDGNTYDKDHPLTIKGNDLNAVYTSLKATAEEGMEIGFEAPEWLTYRINAENKIYEFTFNAENKLNLDAKYPIEQSENHVLVFKTKDAATAQTDKVRKVEIPLIYEGLNAETIIINPLNTNLTVKADGKIISGEEAVESVQSTITVREDKFHIVEFAYTSTYDETSLSNVYTYDFSSNGDLDWITTDTPTKDKVTLSFSANTENEKRNAIVMAFPEAVYEKIKSNLESSILDENGIKSIYNTNIIAIINQDKQEVQAERIGFEVVRAYMPEETFNPWMPLEEGWVSVTDFSKDASAPSYNVPNNNVWKASITAETASMFAGDYMFLCFEAVGMTNNQTITGNFGKAVTGNTYDTATGNPIFVNGWGIYFEDLDNYKNDYQVVVKDKDGTTLALCIVEVVAAE